MFRKFAYVPLATCLLQMNETNHPISWDTINKQMVSSLFPAFSVKLRKKA